MKNGNMNRSSRVLRKKAEELFSKRPVKTWSELTEAEAMKLVHELEVHQIELELQNEELNLTKNAEHEIADKYTELYDFSPTGYFSLSREGRIVELNLSGAKLLGKERSLLMNSFFGVFISGDSRQCFSLFFKKVFISNTEDTCEVTLLPKYGPKMDVVLAGKVTENGEQCRISVLDITERRRKETILSARNTILEFSYHSSLDELLKKALEEIEVLSKSKISFFHFVEEDQVTLSLQTWSANALKKMGVIYGNGPHYRIDQAGVWANCVASRSVVVHNDYLSPSHRKGLAGGYAPVIRELVVPVFRNEKIVAILGVGNKETDYDQADIQSISQIADIVWDIAGRKQTEEDAQNTTEALKFLAQYSDLEAKLDFFALLAQFLARSLDANFVCIDRLEGDGLSARTLAVWHDGVFEDNLVYALKDTPCGYLVGKTVCCFPAGVTSLFPRNTLLQDLNAESYVGVTLWSHTGIPIGLVAVIKSSPLFKRRQAEELLKLVAVRASGELERLDVETERRKAEQLLTRSNEFNNSLLQTIPFGMDIVDENGNILFLSDNLKRYHGEIAPGKKCWDLYRDDKRQCSDCPLHAGITIGETSLYEAHGVLGGKVFEIYHTGMIFNGKKAMLEVFVDITERKQADDEIHSEAVTTGG